MYVDPDGFEKQGFGWWVSKFFYDVRHYNAQGRYALADWKHKASGGVLPLMELEFPGVELAYSTTGEIRCQEHAEHSPRNRRPKS